MLREYEDDAVNRPLHLPSSAPSLLPSSSLHPAQSVIGVPQAHNSLDTPAAARSTWAKVTSAGNSSRFDSMLTIQTRMDEMQKHHEESQESLRLFIEQQLQSLQSSLSLEVQTAHNSLQQKLDRVASKDELHGEEDTHLKKEQVTYNEKLHEHPREVAGTKNDEDEPLDEKDDIGHDDGKPSFSQGSPRGAPLKTEFQMKGRVLSEKSADKIKNWDFFQDAVAKVDNRNNVYHDVLNSRVQTDAWYRRSHGRQRWSIWHHLFHHVGCVHCLLTTAPATHLARFVESRFFVCLQMTAIVSNVVLMWFESDLLIKAALAEPRDRKSVV